SLNPSCLISKAHRGPSGTVRDGVGRQGSMKPVGRAGERVSTTSAIACCWHGSERFARKRRKLRQVLYLLPELSATSVRSSPSSKGTPASQGNGTGPTLPTP